MRLVYDSDHKCEGSLKIFTLTFYYFLKACFLLVGSIVYPPYFPHHGGPNK